jgi:hypothetical protein
MMLRFLDLFWIGCLFAYFILAIARLASFCSSSLGLLERSLPLGVTAHHLCISLHKHLKLYEDM